MPRAPRAPVGDQCYPVLNRGNARQQVFFKDGDYQAFLKALAHATIEVPLRVLAWCLLPDHFHLVVWTHHDGDLSRWMHWLQNTHVRRYHQHYHSSGHLWQLSRDTNHYEVTGHEPLRVQPLVSDHPRQPLSLPWPS